MKILTVVGKVDSRAIVYPLARALSLSGLTAVITDDGAYRRLYNGQSMQGTVSGVDISVGYKADEDLKNSLNKSGVPYDNIIYVSSGHVPEDSTGVIVCHGVDRSIMESVQQDEEDVRPSRRNEESKKTVPVKVDEPKEDEPLNDGELGQNAEDNITEAVEEKDTIEIPAGIPFVELQISYASPSKKGLPAITLKEMFMNYIYSCEERKELAVFGDKNFNKMLAKLVSSVFSIEANELSRLLERTEYIKGK